MWPGFVRRRGRDLPHRRWQDQDEGYTIRVVQCDYFLFNVVKEDIIFKEISAIVRRWSVRSKVLSDDLEEGEDLHNKLKCDQITSDEQIAADNVNVSTLETSISGRNAMVAQLTEEIDTLEKDIAAGKSELSRCDRDFRETVGGILRGHKSMSSDIENSMLFSTQSVVPIVPRNTREVHEDVLHKDFSRAKCSEPRDECVVIFRTVPRNQRVFPAVCQSER